MKSEIKNFKKKFARGDLVEVSFAERRGITTHIGIVYKHVMPASHTSLDPRRYNFWSVLISGKLYAVIDKEMVKL